jgi:hypothetical protein
MSRKFIGKHKKNGGSKKFSFLHSITNSHTTLFWVFPNGNQSVPYRSHLLDAPESMFEVIVTIEKTWVGSYMKLTQNFDFEHKLEKLYQTYLK